MGRRGRGRDDTLARSVVRRLAIGSEQAFGRRFARLRYVLCRGAWVDRVRTGREGFRIFRLPTGFGALLALPVFSQDSGLPVLVALTGFDLIPCVSFQSETRLLTLSGLNVQCDGRTCL